MNWRRGIVLALVVVLQMSACVRSDEPANAVSSSAAADLEAMLQTFRKEFVAISPGSSGFPAQYTFGPDASAAELRVSVGNSFEVSKLEMYQSLYEAVTGNNPSRWKGTRNSVEQVTGDDAIAFCQKVTELMRMSELIDADQVVRLPTEIEWEYFARAGTTTRFSFGDEAQAAGDIAPIATLLDPYAWHTGNAAGNDPAVGVLKPNPWGLYDIHGYLWEICADDWTESLKEVADKSTASDRSKELSRVIVMRGGSWKDKYSLLESSSRKPFQRVTGRDDAIGFRCVISR
ncbi:MAG: formylglycine-generating enzyme family protein [Planctomyces sp.]|nr:formylglycine-generating enzyme family protein [Planctomyces sp.]